MSGGKEAHTNFQIVAKLKLERNEENIFLQEQYTQKKNMKSKIKQKESAGV